MPTRRLNGDRWIATPFHYSVGSVLNLWEFLHVFLIVSCLHSSEHHRRGWKLIWLSMFIVLSAYEWTAAAVEFMVVAAIRKTWLATSRHVCSSHGARIQVANAPGWPAVVVAEEWRGAHYWKLFHNSWLFSGNRPAPSVWSVCLGQQYF